MRILDSTKSLSVLATDTSNGLGNIEPLECTVTEELNGIYECEFAINTNDPHYADLKSSGLFKIPVNESGDEQIFRVYEWGEEISQVAHIKAQHITYDLNKVTVKPFSATGASNVKTQILAHILGSYDFTMTTDITNTTSTFNLTIPRSFRECMGGYEGSLLDVFHGEYEYDNLTVKMLARRGADNGVRIAYGKNLTDFKQEQNLANVYDAVYGYAVVDEVTYEASGIYNKTGASSPKVLNVDFSDKYDTGEVPTSAELLTYATAYATNNDIEIPKVNIDVSFVPLWQTAEYKDILPLEKVNLGDTVHVYFDKLNVTASSRVIKTVWNVMTKKYDEIELGQARANLGTVINESVETAVNDSQGFLESELESMSKLIVNGLGLHITRDTQGRIYLHNAEDLATSQYQYIITSSGFMLSEDYGQTWSSGWDISGNAILNSLSTITLKALEIYGSYIEGSQIRFGDANGTNILARVNDNDTGVLFEGTGFVEFEPQGAFTVTNKDTNGAFNYLQMQVLTVGGYNASRFNVSNYKPTGHNLANDFNMGCVDTGVSSVSLTNYDTTNQTVANSIEMNCALNTNRTVMNNYFMGTANKATEIYMDSSQGWSVMNLYTYSNNGGNTSFHTISMPANSSMSINSGSDLVLSASGAVRIYSQGGQDIQISAADDLHIGWSDKLYFNNVECGFRSDGSIGRL